MVNLIIELSSYSKERVLDILQFQLSSKDALEKLREIKNVGIEDELGYYFAPSQVSCRIRPVA